MDIDITTDLSPTDRLVAGWRTSHLLHGSYYRGFAMTDQQPTNAAGVPLTLIGTPDPVSGIVSIDQSGIPAGIDGKEYSSADIAAMDAETRQQLFEALLAKYAGVSIDEGHGTRIFNTEMDMLPTDDAIYQRLEQLGCIVPAADPAPASPPPAVDTATAPTAAPVAAPVVPPITADDVAAAPPAQPAAMTQQSAPDTHVTVHNESVSLLHRAWADVVAGVEDAAQLFERALHHVFPRGV